MKVWGSMTLASLLSLWQGSHSFYSPFFSEDTDLAYSGYFKFKLREPYKSDLLVWISCPSQVNFLTFSLHPAWALATTPLLVSG